MREEFSRRDFGKLVGAGGLAVGGLAGCSEGNVTVGTRAAARAWRVTGPNVPALGGFDSALKAFMQARNISCGSLAVTRKGKLVLARGYTWSSDAALKTQPTSLFRIASISKPFTSAAVMRLVQDGKLKLTDRLTDLLPLGAGGDPRLRQITVLRLLQHLGGWDRDLTPDPMFRDFVISERLGVPLPVRRSDIMRYATGLKLDHDPGKAYAYSNYGYLLLGRIIEKAGGKGYSAYVQEKVLNPLKIKRMRLGRTLTRAAGEVPYSSQDTGKTVFDASGKTVPAAYGGFNLENMDAHGGWLASAVDLTRFAHVYDGGTQVLNSASISRTFGKPEVGMNGDGWWYGCGWQVRPVTGGRNTWHTGSLPGTFTLMVRRFDGLSWAVLFDQRDDPSGKNYGDIDPALHKAADAVRTWPAGDLSGNYF